MLYAFNNDDGTLVGAGENLYETLEAMKDGDGWEVEYNSEFESLGAAAPNSFKIDMDDGDGDPEIYFVDSRDTEYLTKMLWNTDNSKAGSYRARMAGIQAELQQKYPKPEAKTASKKAKK